MACEFSHSEFTRVSAPPAGGGMTLPAAAFLLDLLLLPQVGEII